MCNRQRSTYIHERCSRIDIGVNLKEPKRNMFRFFFGFLHENKQTIFRFVSVIRTCVETTELNITVSKQRETFVGPISHFFI